MGVTRIFSYYRPYTDENLWSFEACKRAPTCIYPLFDRYYHYSASLVLKRVRIRCCARRCCCKVFSGRRCTSSAVLAHYSTGTTSSSMKGMQRRFYCKVFSGKQRRKNAVSFATEVNKYLLVPLFKLETAEIIRNSVTKDAFFNVSIHKIQHLLQFNVHGQTNSKHWS